MIEEIFRRLDAAKEVCIDAETSGLDWRSNHVVGHVVTFGPAPGDSYYVPVRHAPGGNLEGTFVPQTKDGWQGHVHPFEEELVKRLDRQDLLIFGHNLAFDNKFYYRLGLKFEAKFEDTIINAPLINEYMASFSLDALAKAAGVEQKKITIYDYIQSMFPEARTHPKQAMSHFWRLRGDDPQAVEYAAGDGTSTWQLRDKQHVELANQELTRVHQVECQLIPVLSRMTCRGVKIDERRLVQVKRIIEDKCEEALRKLPEGFNPRSPLAVRKVMEEAGHTDWPLSEKMKAPSFPESWLEKYPAGQDIIAVRKFSNLKNSFVEPMLTTHLWKGRVHTEYNQLRGDEYGTITGRLSSSNPNLQQVNKRNKELGWLHRSIFVPDDGMEWGSADYKQMEPCLLAYYSRCKVLIEGFNANPRVNPHQAVADATGFDYDTGKRMNQSILTGAGKKSLTIKWGMTMDQVTELFNTYFERMPEIRNLQRRAARVMQDRGYVKSLLGRRARLNDPSRAYVAVNRLLQCGNADCLKLKMIEIDGFLRSEGDTTHLLNNVHDALDFQYCTDKKPAYNEALRIMTDFGENCAIKIDIPIEVDAGEGKSWAEATWGVEQ